MVKSLNELYHGSRNKFKYFEIQKKHLNGSALGYGIYLTNNIERAKKYASRYLYINEIKPNILNNSRKLSCDKITLNFNEVTTIVEKIAKQQIKNDDYPYILSDWAEPTSDT